MRPLISSLSCVLLHAFAACDDALHGFDPETDARPDPSAAATPEDPALGDPEPPDPDDAPADSRASTRTVLLIPGTTIKGEFFEDMAARLLADGFDPVIYEPPDLLTGSLALGARRIGDVVQRLLAETGDTRLHIVAECNGGVATRYYLQVLDGHVFVDEVVTFVSAHHGTWASPIGTWVTGFQALADITPGSELLRTLDAAPFPPDLSLTSIYSCWDELVQPYWTSHVEGAVNVLFCDHYLGHFDGFWDPVFYARMLQALRGERDAPTRL